MAAFPDSPLRSSRLCRLRQGDQTGTVSAGSGETVARHVLPMPYVRLCAHWRVHQQVGGLMYVHSRLFEPTSLFSLMSEAMHCDQLPAALLWIIFPITCIIYLTI